MGAGVQRRGARGQVGGGKKSQLVDLAIGQLGRAKKAGSVGRGAVGGSGLSRSAAFQFQVSVSMSRQGFCEFAGLLEHQGESLLRRQARQVRQLKLELTLGIIGRELQDAGDASRPCAFHGHLRTGTPSEYPTAEGVSIDTQALRVN